jgi:hypothetical protein
MAKNNFTAGSGTASPVEKQAVPFKAPSVKMPAMPSPLKASPNMTAKLGKPAKLAPRKPRI